MKYLNSIINEFNPLKDMDKVGFRYEPAEDSFAHDYEKALALAGNNIGCIIIGWVKPAARGCLIGAIGGGLFSILTGDNPAHGADSWASYGAFVDLAQYNTRLYGNYIRAVIKARRQD